MIRQGLSISIIPTGKTDGVYHISVSSSAWDGERCIASRQAAMGIVEMPNGVSAQPENGLWMLDFLEVATQVLQRDLNPPPGASTIFSNGHVSGG